MTAISLLFLLILIVINIFMTISNKTQGFSILDRVVSSPVSQHAAEFSGELPEDIPDSVQDNIPENIPDSLPADLPETPLLPRPDSAPDNSAAAPLEKEGPFSEPRKDNYVDAIRVFSISFDENKNAVSVIYNENSALTEDDIKQLGQRALEKYDRRHLDRGLVSSRYLYQIRHRGDGLDIYFFDYTMERSMTNRLFQLCLFVGLIGILVLFVLVWFLSGWIIKPVENAFEKQKTFIADASHELKTPLTIITTNAEILSTLPGGHKWVANILEQSGRMNRLIRDLLELARLDNAQQQASFSEFDLSHAVSASALSFESIAFETRKKYLMEIGDHLSFRGDEQQIRQLVTILLDNAFKYSGEKGCVSIKLSGKGEKRILTVYNTGKGISAEDQKHIFERFYRSDTSRSRETGGYGLGLSIAAGIVEYHKGQIRVKSDESTYTQITVTL